MVKGWEERGNAQGMSTFCPCKGCEGWTKGGSKVAIVKESPPNAHAKGVKDGQRVVQRWPSSKKAHPMPMQEV
ncbi:hypothetical protein AC622_00405 [Bacillus sp. FJAT-27916]|nr:hypothetical protein AC622_00405 [Bacillus sp. FJAT-27916]